MNNFEKNIYFRCDDNAEGIVFTKYIWTDDNDIGYEISFEDSYVNRIKYNGILGRLKRAWCAFWNKPIYYTSVCCQDEERIKKFLQDCLALINNKTS